MSNIVLFKAFLSDTLQNLAEPRLKNSDQFSGKLKVVLNNHSTRSTWFKTSMIKCSSRPHHLMTVMTSSTLLIATTKRKVKFSE